MRQNENHEEKRGIVTDSERLLFVKNLLSFKKNIADCIVCQNSDRKVMKQNQPENQEYVDSQLEKTVRDVEEMSM